MSIDENFFSKMEKFVDGLVTKAQLEKASSEQSSSWGWTDQKNFSHGWFVGFLEGVCYTHFAETFDREPNVEEDARLVEMIRKQRFKIKDMIEREFDLSILQKNLTV